MPERFKVVLDHARRKCSALPLPLPLGGLGTTYDVHLGLIGMRVVDVVLVLIELFFARCYG